MTGYSYTFGAFTLCRACNKAIRYVHISAFDGAFDVDFWAHWGAEPVDHEAVPKRFLLQ